jgi:hypothetical protein
VAEAVRIDYAGGLTEHQHRVHLANWSKEQLEKADDPIDLLMQTRDEIRRVIDGMKRQRNKAHVARTIARYYDGESRKARASLSVPETVSGAASAKPLDPAGPERVAPRERRNPEAMDTNRTAYGPADAGAPVRMDATDADALPVPVDPGTTDKRTPVRPALETPFAANVTTDIEKLLAENPGFDD